MCISIPGRVVAIRDFEAEIDVLGARRTARTILVPEVEVGDYVLTSAGLVMQIMDEEEAEASIALFQELMTLELDGEDAS